jgi:hypothetical protein
MAGIPNQQKLGETLWNRKKALAGGGGKPDYSGKGGKSDKMMGKGGCKK